MAVSGHGDIYGGDEGLRHHLCLHHGEHLDEGASREHMEDLHEDEHGYNPAHRGEYGCPEHAPEDEPTEFHDMHESGGIGEIHRGISVSLPDRVHKIVHDLSRPVHERAQALLGHVSDHPGHLGMHWTTENRVAEDFAERSAQHEANEDQRGRYALDDFTWGHEQRYKDTPLGKPGTAVVFHAHEPSLDVIENDGHRLSNGGAYGWSEHGEREVPIRDTQSLDLKGISWAPMHSDDEVPGHGEYTHHDFGHEHTASAQAQRMSVEDLLGLHSNEALRRKQHFSGDGFAGHGDDTRVSTVYDRKAAEMAKNPGAWGELDEPIRTGSIDPVLLETSSGGHTVVSEGQHRIVRAHQLGVTHLPVSYDPGSQAHRYDWDEPEPLDEHTAAALPGQDENGEWFYGAQPAHTAELPPEMHRGVGMYLPRDLHDHLRDESVPAADRAHALLSHMDEHSARQAKYGDGGLGIHWSGKESSALGFATRYDQQNHPWQDFVHDPRATRVVLHAQTADPSQMLRSKRKLDEHEIFGINHGEGEIPLKKRSRVHLNGISWGVNEKDAPLTRHDFPQQIRRTAGVHSAPEPGEDLLFHFAARDEDDDYDHSVPPAERTESVRHMLDHYKPYDFPTWKEVSDNSYWHHPVMRAFVDHIRQHGVQRPIPVDYEQDPPQVRNGHTRLLAAERAGVTHVPTRQHQGWIDPDDEPDLPRLLEGHESKEAARSGAEPSSDYKDFLGHFEAAGMIDLYHHTSPETAAKIYREKRMTSKENTGSIFFTTDPDSEYAAGFGDGVVHVRMPQSHLEAAQDRDHAWQDDEFPSGEQHWAIHHSELRPEHFVDPSVGRREAASPEEYGMSHRPDSTGPPLHDLSEGDMMPRDFYDRMHEYNLYSHDDGLLGEAAYQAERKIRLFRGKPEKKVTIWRSAPAQNPESRNAKRGEINHGDWVGLSRHKALAESYEANDPPSGSLPANHPSRYHIWSARVPAKHVRNPDGDMTEWGYFGPDVKDIPHVSEQCSHRARVKPREAAHDVVAHFDEDDAGSPEVAVEHQERPSGGATYPHYHALTATHPDGTTAELRYMTSKRNSRGVVDHAFLPGGYADSLGRPLVREARRLHPGALIKGLPGIDEDWGQHLPGVTSLHRNLTMKLSPEDHALVHDESVPKAQRARHLIGLMEQGGPSMHWASQRGRAAAAKFGDHEFRAPGDTQVSVSAAPPAREHVETDPERISRHGGYAYQEPDWEVPLKQGAPVTVSSVRWRAGDGGWTGHQFRDGHQFTAGYQLPRPLPSAAVVAQFEVTAAAEFGPKPEFRGAPDHLSDDEKMAHWDQQRQVARDWESRVTHGISTGELHPDRARELGHYFDGHQTDRHGDPTWQPMPEHLYHVTTDLPGVREHGLKTRSELNQARGGHGLGGGPDNMISVTDDHDTAKSILRAVHEFHHVVNGRYTPAQMWEDAKAGRGAPRPFHEDLASYYQSGWKDGDELPRGLDLAVRGKESRAGGLVHSPQEMAEREGPGWTPHRDSAELTGGDGVKRYNVWERDLDPDKRREHAADFYKNFAAYRQYAGGHEDPLFFSTDTKAFAAKNPSHFAIVHARPRPGALGHPASSLGEWRTGTGDALEVTGDEQGEHHQKEGSVSLAARYAPGLPNPQTGGDEWFHGTQSRPGDFVHGFSHNDAPSHEEEELTGHLSHWNTLLGSHFAADHGVAEHFARQGASTHDSDEEDWGGDDPGRSRYQTGEPQSVIHARLHLRNPKVYDSEFDMDHEAYEHEHGERKNYIANHFRDDYEDEDYAHPDYDPDTPGDMEEWPLAARYRHDDKQPIPREQVQRRTLFSNPDAPEAPERTRWLNSHPDKAGIARRFREHLEGQGHDGILYGNEFEDSHATGDGGHYNLSAIAFRPHQAEITQHHQVDAPHLSGEEAEHQRARMPQPGQAELPGVEEHADRFPNGFLHGHPVVAHFEEPRTAAGPYMQQKLFHMQPDPALNTLDSGRHNPEDPLKRVRHRQETEVGYVPPAETFDDPELGNRDEERGLYRHPVKGWHCHACSAHQGEPVFHDSPDEADEHGTTQTNWDDEYPRIPGTVHRGMRLDDDGSYGRQHLHALREAPAGESAAREVLGHLGDFGTHWTGDESQARHYADVGTGGYRNPGEHDMNVVVHARKPAREDIETDPDVLRDRNVFGMGYHDDEEIPLQEGAPVHVTGVSWKFHDEPHSAWRRHDFGEHPEHTAAVDPGRRNLADIGSSMLAYDKDLSPDDHAFISAAIDHIRRGAPASEPIDADDAERMARGMRTRDRMEQAGWQLGPGQDKIRYGRGFTVNVGEHHRATLSPNSPSGWHVRTHPADYGSAAGHLHHDLDVRDEDLPSELHRYYGSPQIRGELAAQQGEVIAEGRGHTAAIEDGPQVPSFTWKHQTYGPNGGYTDAEQEVAGPFYHGSRSKGLRPGSQVRAGMPTNSWGDEGDRSQYVHFTTDLGGARDYSARAGGHVYEVEPTGDVRSGYNGSEWKSQHPLRVIRRVPGEEMPPMTAAVVAHFEDQPATTPSPGEEMWGHLQEGHGVSGVKMPGASFMNDLHGRFHSGQTADAGRVPHQHDSQGDRPAGGQSAKDSVSRMFTPIPAEELEAQQRAREPKPERLDDREYSVRDVSRHYDWEGFDPYEIEHLVHRPERATFTKEDVPVKSLRHVGEHGNLVPAPSYRSIASQGDDERERLERLERGYEQGDPVPPIVAVRDGEHHIIADGSHRAAVYAERGHTHIPAFVTQRTIFPGQHTAAYDWHTDEGPFTWDEIARRHPRVYGDDEDHEPGMGEGGGHDIADAAAELYHDRPGYPYSESTGELHPENSDEMQFHPRTVDVNRIDYMRVDRDEHDPRVERARKGFQDHRQREKIPPLILVHRHGVYQVADGSHRGNGAAQAGWPSVRAYVAYSPHEDEPFAGRDGEPPQKGPFHGAETRDRPPMMDHNGEPARPVSFPGFPHTTERPRPQAHEAVLHVPGRGLVQLDSARDAVLAPSGPVEAVVRAVAELGAWEPQTAAEATGMAREFGEVLAALRDGISRAARTVEEMPITPDVADGLHGMAACLNAAVAEADDAARRLPPEASWQESGPPNR